MTCPDTVSTLDVGHLAETFAALADLDRRRAALYNRLAELLSGRARADSGSRATTPGIPDFARQLSARSSALVARTLARSSVEGRVLDRQRLCAETGLSENALRGATGDIGRKWARTFPGRANPFIGRSVWGTREHEYSIPTDLGEEILKALA
jgi:hypothetical protein